MLVRFAVEPEALEAELADIQTGVALELSDSGVLAWVERDEGGRR